jgi:prevent-host-death family protein
VYQEIGIFDAKTKLSELLRAVRDEGRCYTITVRGESVADLVPSAVHKNARTAIEAMRAIEKVEGVRHEEIEAWIRKGRQ